MPGERSVSPGPSCAATKSVAATQIESLVVQQIRGVGRDAEVFEAALAAARARADGAQVSTRDLRRALALWDDVWGALTLKEQARVAVLMIERVSYDGADGKVALTFRPSGIKALAEEARE